LLKLAGVVRVMVTRVMMVMVVMAAGKSRHRDHDHCDEEQGQKPFHAPNYSHEESAEIRI